MLNGGLSPWIHDSYMHLWYDTVQVPGRGTLAVPVSLRRSSLLATQPINHQHYDVRLCMSSVTITSSSRAT
jgi:hypothetical protein